jgi:NADP-dependent 3-hydroxy acid dehydrogenase YdfG
LSAQKPISTAIVTGAGSGIGQGIALTLAKKGLKLVLVGRDPSKLEATAAKIAALPNTQKPLALSCDVADHVAVDAMSKTAIDWLGSIDLLVCNAGTNVRDRSMAKLSHEDWQKMIDTNLTGAFNLVHAVLPTMREQKSGLVIQICSVSGKRASVLGGIGYSASKFGQAALGLCLGREENANGIRSSVIYPGEVETPILDARPVPVPQDRRDIILQPDDIAAAVAFLVDLNPRAHVPELIIKPTVDDFA